MLFGLAAGLTWAAETVFLGVALSMIAGVPGTQAAMIAPFAAAFLHDLFSAVLMTVFNSVCGKEHEVLDSVRSGRWRPVALAAVIGGPVGMTGYILTVNCLGASFGAVASAVYPAVGAVLACIFLKERMQWYRWVFLGLSLLAVYGLSFSPGMQVRSFWLGIAGVLMCALGWGTEAVILAKTMSDGEISAPCALQIRQTVSALIHGAVVLPLAGGWRFTSDLFRSGAWRVLFTVALAALAATVSYLLYYKALQRIGAARTMALNISYAAWAPLFSLVILHDRQILHPMTALCAAAVLLFGLLSAADPASLKRGAGS